MKNARGVRCCQGVRGIGAGHLLLNSYTRWDQLQRIVNSQSAISVDGTAHYLCP